MTDRHEVDPSVLFSADDEFIPSDAPQIAVVVSLWFPGMGGESLELMTRFTTTAFESVREAGGRPHLVDSSAETLAEARAVVDDYDGVLFLGGGDVDSELYGVPGPVPNSYGTDRRADEFCLDVMRTAIEADRTVFALCRGSQLLNVASGGSLVPDLDPSALHRGGHGRPTFLDEEVSLVPGSRVAGILDRERVTVRSGHHQAVDELGTNLRVTAIADDGVIEGTERTDRTWVVGLQWHPEDSDGNADDRARLFGAFVAQAAQARKASVVQQA